MQTPNSQSSPDQAEAAQQVCHSCRMRKRKCNKELPKCSYCVKRNLTCDYSRPEQNRNYASDLWQNRNYSSDPLWYGFPVDDDRADAQYVDFPTMLFLDPGFLQYGQVDISRPTTPIPVEILHLLGDMDEIRVTASKFFEHIHSWMPFISKKRFYEIHLRPSFQSRSDIVLLLLCLKLITTFPPKTPRNPRTPLYYAVKHFYLEVEGSSVFSVLVLQAGVLISLYELGHAIYPAAFLSVGACARYAHALGLNGGRALNTRRVLTLVEGEERRRIWWAIVILDRFVSIGCPGRPFATADPKLDDLLPADDILWDQGIVRSDDIFALSSPRTIHMSKFALLCQAARLMGQVLHHVSSDSATQDDAWIQLDRTLQSMLDASLNVQFPDNDQITFIYSALIALHTPWLYPDLVDIRHNQRCQHARTVIRQISEKINKNLVENHCFLGRNPEEMPPWGLFFAYRICMAHMATGQHTSDSSEVVKSLRANLLMIDIRWNVAGVYLQLLEAQEVINSF